MVDIGGDSTQTVGLVANAPTRFLRRRIFPAPGTHSSRGLGAVGTLVRAASRSRVDAFDKRTVAGRLVYDARADFTAHAGGEGEVSATEAALIERLAMRKLVLALGDEILCRTQATGTPRDVLEVGQKPAALDAGYVQMLKELGWKPKEKPVPSLHEYLAAKAAAKQQQGGGGGGDGDGSSD